MTSLLMSCKPNTTSNTPWSGNIERDRNTETFVTPQEHHRQLRLFICKFTNAASVNDLAAPNVCHVTWMIRNYVLIPRQTLTMIFVNFLRYNCNPGDSLSCRCRRIRPNGIKQSGHIASHVSSVLAGVFVSFGFRSFGSLGSFGSYTRVILIILFFTYRKMWLVVFLSWSFVLGFIKIYTDRCCCFFCFVYSLFIETVLG